MRGPEGSSPVWKGAGRVWRSVSARLVILLVVSMTCVFGLLGYLNIRLHRQHLEQTTLTSAERLSEVIKRNATYSMLHNERDSLHQMISDMANERGIVRVRIINAERRISFSSDPWEVGELADGPGIAPAAVHGRFHSYRLADGERALGVANPIENAPQCSSAKCHAHPPDQKVLGVLETNISLRAADASLAESTRQVLLSTLLAVLAIAWLSAVFVWRMVRDPLAALKGGTERLGSGELGYQVEVGQAGELADVADAFNTMSSQLCEAREEINAWTRTLEARVEQKTRELSSAQDEMLRVERMASIGKLAAVVAHEINNPLAGILTYAKLLKKRFAGKDDELYGTLDLMESESRRCGEIVKNLMTFARKTSLNYEESDLNEVIGRCVRLVQHKLELANIELQRELAADLPRVWCDAGQIEQVVLALIVNAIDAMPNGGSLTLRTRRKGEAQVEIEVRDDGVGMPADVLANLFEPFFTTKERGRGLGLGLAISRSIIERHEGTIEAKSAPGKGTTLTVMLPVRGRAAVDARPERAA
jgi:two-component system, NtrC family, sensor kinase